MEHLGIVGTGEEYKGPTLMLGLGSGWWDHPVDSRLENPTTKYRESVPDVANSVSGYGLITGIDEKSPKKYGLHTLTYFHSVSPGRITCKPPKILCRKDLRGHR